MSAFPFRQYRRAVWAKRTLRKVRRMRRCLLCGLPLKPGEKAWWPIRENIRHEGIDRSVRMCTSCMDAATL